MSWAVVIALIVAGAVVYLLRRHLYDMLAAGGGAAERARRAEKDLAVTKKQGEIMVENRSVDDVADDLDRGAF